MYEEKEKLAEEMRDISIQIGELKRELKVTDDPKTKERIKELQLKVLFCMETLGNMEE